ncbi:MAG: archaemetzincin family Zn-dependent metalloprotease [Bacteroidetes bacterium]|nr:archaemetzincin family Zn-dependent metalloprotease [Bacteroidota bacterium]
MNLQNITLISFGYFEKTFLEQIADAVAGEFHCGLNLKEGHIDLSEFYDAGRRQYNGNSLLKYVDMIQIPEAGKTLGLFNVDLFIPILTYIFGQAFLGGRTGIASLYRLSNDRYGIIGDDGFLLDRFTKEVIHELGHTFGLIHCNQPTCVMRSSTYVEDIDQKDRHFCLKCRESIGIL